MSTTSVSDKLAQATHGNHDADNSGSRKHEPEQGLLLGEAAGGFPSDTFLWLTLGSIILSASMKLSGHSKDANFVGEWAPTFLALGTYSKLMKLEKAISKLG